MVERVPPSVLPGYRARAACLGPRFAPTRGEIDSLWRHRETVNVVASGSAQPISPPVGEMSGRTEGGDHALDTLREHPHAR